MARATFSSSPPRFVVNDLTVSHEVEIACLTPTELDRGKTARRAGRRRIRAFEQAAVQLSVFCDARSASSLRARAGRHRLEPINFARAYGARGRAVVAWNTTGYPMVPAGTSYSFARAAGAASRGAAAPRARSRCSRHRSVVAGPRVGAASPRRPRDAGQGPPRAQPSHHPSLPRARDVHLPVRCPRASHA